MLNFLQKVFGSQTTPPQQPKMAPPCSHKWYGGFGWYAADLTFYTDTKQWKYIIYKPYVCIHCKQRKDVTLATRKGFSPSMKSAQVHIAYDNARFSKIRLRADIEAEISDMQLVDRAYIEKAMELFPDKFPAAPESRPDKDPAFACLDSQTAHPIAGTGGSGAVPPRNHR